MTEYNLSFFEAMELVKNGQVVISEDGDIVSLKSCPVKLGFRESYTKKWRIIEPESWLDTTLKSKGELDPCYKVGFQDGAKAFAREAIRRIAIDYPSHGGTTGAAQILRNLIGEAE